MGDGSDDRHLHYYFIEAEDGAASAPLVLWLNGGPGSSSLFGMFTEVGQLTFSRDSLSTNSTEAPRLFRNPDAWTTVANMLFLESPVGVGWSYCAESLQHGKPCVCNDTSTANENHDALLAFTARHPSLKDRPFYISGESYAGIYIPTLAEVIMKKGGMNLQGMAVGNGCWGSGENLYCGFGKEQKRIEAEFLFGHGFYSKAIKARLDTSCNWTPGKVSPISEACAKVLAEVGSRSPHRAGNPSSGSMGTSEYIYDQCGYNPQMHNDQSRLLLASTMATVTTATAAVPIERVESEPFGPLGFQQKWCGARQVAQPLWNSLPSVATAMHMKPFTGNALDYSVTRTGPGSDLRPLYKTLAEKYRLLIFSGDSDGCVPFTGSAEWTSGLGFPVVSDWRPWVAPMSSVVEGSDAPVPSGRVGYVTEYGGDAKGFAFATVNNAGHEVPTFQPRAAKALISRFLANQPL